MILVCLAAVLSAALQVLGRFTLPALAPVALNVMMIAALGAGYLFARGDSQAIVGLLCGGVMLGGLLQLALPAWDLGGGLAPFIPTSVQRG